MAANTPETDVVRRQPDGTWRWVIDVPFGITPGCGGEG